MVWRKARQSFLLRTSFTMTSLGNIIVLQLMFPLLSQHLGFELAFGH